MRSFTIEIVASVIAGLILYFICKWLDNHYNQVSKSTRLDECFFYASSLTYNGVDSIREVLDMNKIKEILFKFLGNKYSEKFILLISLMLEVNEEKRPDFIELEKKIRETFQF